MFTSEMLAGRGRGNRYEWGTSKEARKQASKAEKALPAEGRQAWPRREGSTRASHTERGRKGGRDDTCVGKGI
jgi:hypothetical protein